jgi:squalene-hopene/tetraprenyl-beta-curcumene cyclase
MKTLASLLVVGFLASVSPAQLPSQESSFQKEVATVHDKGLAWLIQQQEANGSWRGHPAITALAATSILRAGRPLATNEQAAADRAIGFILSNVRTNGAIYGADDKDKYPNYSTAICLMALLAHGKPAHTETIRQARKFLLNSQFDEGEGIESSDPSYGGIGYGRRERPDLSNMQWTLEALRLTESLDQPSETAPHVPSKLHWERAIQFLSRCQNLPSHNDQAWAKNARTNDLGGFVYMPGFSFADGDQPLEPGQPLRSHGSMTYAGLKSFLYAEMKKDDPRIRAALDWLRRNYTLEENPGLGQQGLYYYYHTVAKSLTVFGDDTFTDAAGKQHDWRYELLNKFVANQDVAGFWKNPVGRFMENDPVLVTSYSLLAIQILQARQYP